MTNESVLVADFDPKNMGHWFGALAVIAFTAAILFGSVYLFFDDSSARIGISALVALALFVLSIILGTITDKSRAGL